MDTATLLASLQHADSFFPGGGIAFSWGLETTIGDGMVRGAESVAAYVGGQLEQRWAVCDRLALVAAWRAEELAEVRRIDAALEAMSLALELREGSRRAGLSEEGAQAASAHTFCVGLLGAALRLGAIGHIHSQETLLALRPAIAALIAQPAAPVEEMYSCTPAAEIAAMRHEVQTARLFAN